MASATLQDHGIGVDLGTGLGMVVALVVAGVVNAALLTHRAFAVKVAKAAQDPPQMVHMS